jgi:acyl-coenzyme A synthetase/AMP-(fatty) acid ligase
MQRRLVLGAADVFPALASFAFDMCIPELYLPIAFGACTLIVSREVAVDGSRLLAELRSAGATFLHATPTTWNMLLESGWRGDPPWRMIVGAEALPPDLATRLVEVGGSLLNFYGPTETTVWSAVYEFLFKDDPVCVGRPLANQQIYILDRNMQPLPVGVAGEVYIGGDGLSRGYRNRPELTVEKFVPDPFGNKPGARLYRTGDLARRRSDGNIEFIGRVDYQVKLRGFRIELGEIEAALGQHPSVRARAVLVQEVTPGDRRLVAYLVPEQGHAPTTSELRRFLQAKLPDYMVPSQFVFLEAMPLNSNGKVNRRALSAPGASRPEVEGGFVAPRNPVEVAVARSWAEVLRIDKVSVYDHFFELGGHSLLAIRLMTRLRETLFVDLPLRTVFETPTLAGMAEAVSRSLLGDASSDEMALLLAELEGS